jgi:hypothetical protein
MGESGVADSGGAMAKACSEDLRERVIEAVEAGGSRRGAAKRFAVSASSAGRVYECPAARERVAYRAQALWLAIFGRTLEQEFGLDDMTLKLSTECLRP